MIVIGCRYVPWLALLLILTIEGFCFEGWYFTIAMQSVVDE